MWWATWDGVDGPLLTQEPVQLDSLNAAQRYLRSLQRTVVGLSLVLVAGPKLR